MKIHFISIGGSIMHNLAIALIKKGYEVSGSDDEIFEPAKSRLAEYGILPRKPGWFREKIDNNLDAVILGMHAKKDNPELLEAMNKGIKIFSFPEFVYENSKNKKRIVIAGSHGKTTITSMIMHVLAKMNFDFDYVVGSQVPGFADSVRLSAGAGLVVIEGDEYLSSALDSHSKFLWYKPHIALVSGIAWDHMNVFPTYEIYKSQFSGFTATLNDDAVLIWCSSDSDLEEIVSLSKVKTKKSYGFPEYRIVNNKFVVKTKNNIEFELNIFGSHNLMNLEGARMVCAELGVPEEKYFRAMADFKGAGKRLEVIYNNGGTLVFRDFAHAPSKVRGTVEGIKNQFPEKKIYACLELHTYSSLNKEFLLQYKNSLNGADVSFIFLNEEAARLKNMVLPSSEEVIKAFNNNRLQVLYSNEILEDELRNLDYKNSVLLLMSSGNFNGWIIEGFIQKINKCKSENENIKCKNE